MRHTCTVHAPGKPCYSRCGCRCDRCRSAASNYQQRVLAGITARVPGIVVLDHVRRLQASGMTVPDIATAAGIPDHTLGNLVHGRSHDMNRETAALVLAVRPGQNRRGLVDPTGTVRRLRALAAIGWDSGTLAGRLGVHGRRVEDIRSTTRKLHAPVAARVADLYRELSMRPVPGWRGDRARTLAASKGWAPPLAWDDDMGPHGIDNPAATPYTDSHAGAVETIAEKVEWLADGGLRLPAIIARLDTTRDALWRALDRHNRLDLWRRLTRDEAA